MARKKSTPAQQQQPDLNAMFPPIGQEIPVEEEQQAQPDLAAQIAELRGTLKTMSEGVKSRDDRINQLVTALATNPTSQPRMMQTAMPAIDLSKLPDVTKDPEGFRRGLNEQIQSVAAAQAQAVIDPRLQAQQQEKKLLNLWERFTKKYEDLADYQDIAETVAGHLVRDAVAGGADPEKFIFGADNGEAFMDRVAGQINDRLGKIRGSEDDDEDGEAQDARGRAVPRTIGLDAGTGGNTSAPTARPQGANQRQAGSTLIDELKEAQARAKVY